jgi:hypothetical protein
MNIQDYYKNEHIRKRVNEFLGCQYNQEATCIFLTQCDTTGHTKWDYKQPSEIAYYWDHGLDINRSLWDSKWLLAHLDIEYVNFDNPYEIYSNPIRPFMIQHPIELMIEKQLLSYGITALHVLSGRGHHFTWKMARNSDVYQRLVRTGFCALENTGRTSLMVTELNRGMDRELVAAFYGLGMVMEFLSLEIIRSSKNECVLPIDISAIEEYSLENRREMISIDISEYGDMLTTRIVRVPYSVYLKKHWMQNNHGMKNGVECSTGMASIPLFEMSITDGLSIARNLEQITELASRASSNIPDNTLSMNQLVDEYEKSRSRDFHNWFYTEKHAPPERWGTIYDSLPGLNLPASAVYILANPNDTLLKPSGIRHIVRVFMALRWHPRHIAGLIRSKYEKDFGWGDKWILYDAITRADFYTRVFSNQILSGIDTFTDFHLFHEVVNRNEKAPDDLSIIASLRQSLTDRVKEMNNVYK